jgi:hypothetical protein
MRVSRAHFASKPGAYVVPKRHKNETYSLKNFANCGVFDFASFISQKAALF